MYLPLDTNVCTLTRDTDVIQLSVLTSKVLRSFPKGMFTFPWRILLGSPSGWGSGE